MARAERLLVTVLVAPLALGPNVAGAEGRTRECVLAAEEGMWDLAPTKKAALR